mgnify:CR=1 FL=1
MDNSNEINALVHLIDDPDELIFNHVKEKLMHLGIGIIPHLEQAWANENFGDIFQNRLESFDSRALGQTLSYKEDKYPEILNL